MTSHPFNILRQDLRWSLRTIRKRPAIAMVIVLSMGLAIGATTAAFSVVNAFMLRSWNSDGMDRVVRLREDYARPGQPPDIRGFTLANLGTWRRENTVFEAIAAGTGQSATLVDGESAERVAAGIVTANFFSVLGFRPILGRTFTAEEDAPDRRDAVVLGYGLWQSRFAGDTAVIGRSITLNGRPRTVVGVMPRGIKHPYQSDLWVPLGYREDAPSGVSVYAPARLRRDVTLERANAELDAMAQRIHDANPAPNVPTGAQVTLLQPEMLGRLDRVLYLLAAAAMLVLLIATANVSNLLLAQGLEQHAEVSVRTALGATRGRLARQFLVYSVLLSVLGGIVGVALSLGTLGPLVSLSPLYGAGEFDIQPRLDVPVLVFTLLTTIVVGVVFGIVPALRTSGANPMAVLRESSRVQTLTRGSRRWLRGFVVVQVALAFVLLIASGAMARGLTALTREPWGFDRRNVLAFEMTVPAYRYQDPSQRLGVIERVIARIGELPGVEAIGATSIAPLWAGTAATGFNIETGPAPNAQEIYLAHRRTVTPGYFGAMQMPLVAGRAFDDRDTEGGVPVAVVSQSLAERYWPGQNPIGKRVKEGPFAGPGAWREVVGVVGSLRENAGTDIPSGDALYFPLRQDVGAVFGEMTVMVRATSEPLLLLASVRSTIAGIDRELPIANASTLENRFASFTATERLSTRLTSGLGGIGLFLSAIGIYGLLSFTLGRRLPEFGIRAALGARPADVRRLIARDALGLLGGGLVIGAVLAYALRPLLDTSMFPGAETGPIVIAGAVIGLIIVTMVSSLIPSLKAGRVNPVRAMH